MAVAGFFVAIGGCYPILLSPRPMCSPLGGCFMAKWGRLPPLALYLSVTGFAVQKRIAWRERRVEESTE